MQGASNGSDPFTYNQTGSSMSNSSEYERHYAAGLQV